MAITALLILTHGHIKTPRLMSANTVMPLPICPPRSCYAGSDAVEFLCAVFPCTAARTCLGEGWYRSRRFRPPFHIVTALFYAPACGHSQTAATANMGSWLSNLLYMRAKPSGWSHPTSRRLCGGTAGFHHHRL